MLENDMPTSAQAEQPGQLITVEAGAVTRNAILMLPESAQGIVLLGSETPVMHRQNIAIGSAFQREGLGALLVDLFSSEELQLDTESGYFRENTDIMQQRFIGVAEWLLEQPNTQHKAVGYFGLGIVGAAALIAAAERPDLVAAVVAEQKDLALIKDVSLQTITAPLLLLSWAQDKEEDSQSRLEQISVEKQLITLSGPAFNENVPAREMLDRASGWFKKHLIWRM